MEKKRTFSVSLFLHKKIKPVFDKGVPCYPIYIQVNYNRTNVKLRPNIDSYHRCYDIDYRLGLNDDEVISKEANYLTEDLFSKAKKLIESKTYPKGEEEEGVVIYNLLDTIVHDHIEMIRDIRKIINKEVELDKEFKLVGFGKRLDRYFSSVFIDLDIHLSAEITNVSKGLLSLSEQIIFKRKRTAIEKYLMLLEVDRFDQEKNISLEKNMNALFWCVAYLEKSGNGRYFYWKLFLEESIRDYKEFYNQEVVPLDDFYYDNMVHIKQINDPLSSEVFSRVNYFIEFQSLMG